MHAVQHVYTTVHDYRIEVRPLFVHCALSLCILTLSLAGLAALLRARVERGWLDVELLTGSYERLLVCGVACWV